MHSVTVRASKMYFPIPISFMDKLDQLVATNLSNEELCMADLEANLLLSSSQIYRKIKQKTGFSPSVYIRNVRLKYAFELIKQSDLSLSEIAYRVGFSGLPYFSRCFSKYFGAAPSSFRNY